MSDDLGEAERGLEPVEDRESVSHDPGERLRRTEAKEDERPEPEGAVVVFDDPVLNRAADRERHQRLGHHPDDPEEDPAGDGEELVAADPEEQAGGRSRVRRAGVVRGQPDSAAIEPAARGVHSYGVLWSMGSSGTASRRDRRDKPRLYSTTRYFRCVTPGESTTRVRSSSISLPSR